MQSTMEVVSTLDPALDRKQTDLLKYADRRDMSLVVEKPGQKCARYHLKPVNTRTFITLVESGATETEKHARAFQCSVVSIENFTPPDGGPMQTYTPTATVEVAGQGVVKYIADEDRNLFPPAVISEIGAVAYQLCFLAGNTAVSWPMLPSLRQALVAISRGAAFQAIEKMTQSAERLRD